MWKLVAINAQLYIFPKWSATTLKCRTIHFHARNGADFLTNMPNNVAFSILNLEPSLLRQPLVICSNLAVTLFFVFH